MPPGPPYTVVVCFEDDRRERFLVARHTRRGWELPGGRVEPGEEPIEGARREFAEETGHALLHARLVLSIDKENGRCHVVTGRWGPAEPSRPNRADEPIQELRFVARLDEVAPLAFPDDPYNEIGRAIQRALR